jgi:hypothetical protein
MPVLWIALALASAPAGRPAAGTAEEFLNAPVWYLEYEVTFTSTHQGSYTRPDIAGTLSFTSRLERVFSGSEVLNLRSPGPGPIGMAALTGVAEGSTPSAADAQRISTQMMSLMDHTANWLVGGAALDEGATDADVTAATLLTTPARIDYRRVDTGKNLEDDAGRRYDTTHTTTITGSGAVSAGGFGVTILELDTARESYVLQLPYGFNSMLSRATMETVDVVTYSGAAPEETRQSDDVPFDRVPTGLDLDAPQEGAALGGVLIRGTLDPASGKIAGEQSFQAHYDERHKPAPGTLVFKYTLTMTPPAKK